MSTVERNLNNLHVYNSISSLSLPSPTLQHSVHIMSVPGSSLLCVKEDILWQRPHASYRNAPLIVFPILLKPLHYKNIPILRITYSLKNKLNQWKLKKETRLSQSLPVRDIMYGKIEYLEAGNIKRRFPPPRSTNFLPKQLRFLIESNVLITCYRSLKGQGRMKKRYHKTVAAWITLSDGLRASYELSLTS